MKTNTTLPFLLLLLLSEPAAGQMGNITESADAWTWSRETGGYAPLQSVRRTVESLDSRGRIVRKDWFVKGGTLYNSSRWTWDADLPVQREIFDSSGKLQARSGFKREKNGVIEYMYKPDGALFLIFYRKTDPAGRISELITVDASSNIMTRRSFLYDSEGRLTASVIRDGDRRVLLASSYSYEPSPTDPSALIRNESIVYADTSAPKETVITSASNAVLFRKGEKSPDQPWPEVSVEAFVRMTSNHARGTAPGAKVLAGALKKILDRTIIKGSCYDWINLVYTELGYTGAKRQSVWSGKESGPFADPLLLQPGDWIMFKNQTYGDIGHSGIFLGWLDFESRSAIVIGYAGQSRTMPGRFREYDISRLFGIVRGKD